MLIVHLWYPIVHDCILLTLSHIADFFCFLLLSLLYSIVSYLLSSILLYLAPLRACHSMYLLYSFYFTVPRLTWYATLTDSIARTMYECYYCCTCLRVWGGGEAKLYPLHFSSPLSLVPALCTLQLYNSPCNSRVIDFCIINTIVPTVPWKPPKGPRAPATADLFSFLRDFCFSPHPRLNASSSISVTLACTWPLIAYALVFRLACYLCRLFYFLFCFSLIFIILAFITILYVTILQLVILWIVLFHFYFYSIYYGLTYLLYYIYYVCISAAWTTRPRYFIHFRPRLRREGKVCLGVSGAILLTDYSWPNLCTFSFSYFVRRGLVVSNPVSSMYAIR